MAPVVGSTVISPDVATPITEAVVASAGESWPWWKWLIAGVGVYGGLTLIGWLTQPDVADAKKVKGGPLGMGGHGHAHRPGGGGGHGGSGGMTPSALGRINEQLQLLVEREDFQGAEKLIKGVIEQMEQALQATPSMEVLLELLGFQKKLADVYRLDGKFALAEERLEDLLKTFTQLQAPAGELAIIKQELSTIAEDQKDHKKAERLLKEALQLQEQSEGASYVNNWPLVYKLGMFRKNESEWAGAEAHFRRAVKLLEGAPRATLDQARAIANQLKMEVIDMLVEQSTFLLFSSCSLSHLSLDIPDAFTSSHSHSLAPASLTSNFLFKRET
jgi:tetratricopeptide (TPR) repeat protein